MRRLTSVILSLMVAWAIAGGPGAPVGVVASAANATTAATGAQAKTKFRKHPRSGRSGRYIVVLTDGVHQDVVAAIATELSNKHRGKTRHLYRKALKGFAAELSEAEALRLSADPRVLYVEEDTLAYGSAIQSGAPWGLDRIDQRHAARDGMYRFEGDGRGVHLYIIDSGVRVSHAQFAPSGRATADYGRYGTEDCNGHGTAVASLAAGTTTGVAKAAFVHAVRVLDCSAVGYWSDIIDGIDWVAANHLKPAVANMSIVGAGQVSSVSDAIRGAVDAGVTFVAAAGNNAVDACEQTPGFIRTSTPYHTAVSAVIVGNADPVDRRYHSSNYGACLDLFAPGTGIYSAYHGSDSEYATMTGTSMASPFVAGAAALYLQRTPAATPAEVLEAMANTATRDALTEVNPGSPNRLLFAAAMGDRTAPAAALTAPAAGATVSGTVDVAANASDDLELASVEFYAGGTLIATDHSAPYSVSWVTNSLANGAYSLTAVAIDSGGNVTTSAARTVVVDHVTVRSAFGPIEAEAYDSMSGIVQNASHIGYLDHGDWVRYGAVDFGSGAASVSISVAVALGYAGKQIQLRIGSTSGPLLGTLTVASTGGWSTFVTQTTPIAGASGVHDLYLVFVGGDGVGNVDRLQFHASTASSAFEPIEAESFDGMSGIVKAPTYIGYLDHDDWVRYTAVDFGSGATSASIRVAVASGYAGKQIQLRIGSTTGTQIGTLTVASTGGWSTFVTQTTPIAGASGVHDLYLVFSGGDGVGNVDWLGFDVAEGENEAGTGELPPAGWVASASASYSPASRAIDRSASYKWQNGRSQASFNDYLQVDLGAPRTFNRIVLEHTGSSNDYPVAYRVDVSDDGSAWTTVHSGAGTPAATNAVLPGTYTKRYVRVTETGSTGVYWFTVNELRLFYD